MAVALQPITTRYKGHRFRSRLEARYAVFMDSLGVEWQYEPEGFALASGFYLPDFYLPRVGPGTWLEIKHHGSGSFFGYCSGQKNPGLINDERLLEFALQAQDAGKGFFIAYGLPSADLLDGFCDYDAEGMLEGSGDPYQWCVCGCGKTVGIEFDGRGDRIDCARTGCSKSSHGDKGYSHNHDLIRIASEAARSARFEYGECGAA